MGIELAVIVAVIGVDMLLLYLATSLEKEHFLLRLFFIMMVLFSFNIIGSICVNVAEAAYKDIAITFYKLTTWTVRVFVAYVAFYFAYQVLLFKGIIKRSGE